MKINRGLLAGLVAGAAAFAVSSCAYDPYYSGASYSGSYGQGYGYGNSGFSTSVFVSTGNPRWGYDPYAGCYYDHTRRSYYDPYLYGYYPVGYRPHYVYGAPHPGGWTHGSSYCPPPSRIHSHTLTNYHNRAERYRSLDMAWSSNVRVSAPTDHHRSEGYGGRETRQQGNQDSHGSTFPQRQERFSPRGGDDWDRRSRDRGSLDSGAPGSRGFTPGSTQFIAPEETARMRDDGRRGGSPDGRFSGRQSPPRMERPVPPQRLVRPEPERRIESPAPTEQPQAVPESPRGDRDHGGNSESRGRGHGVRLLGEG